MTRSVSFFPKKRKRMRKQRSDAVQEQKQEEGPFSKHNVKRRRRSKKSKEIENGAPFFPMEIIANILSRLPVKPLLMYRTVCKAWCALIGSRNFATMHLQRAKLNMFFLADKHRRHPNLNHYLLVNRYREAVVKFRYKGGYQGKKEKVLVGSSIWMQTSLNGLICFMKGTYNCTIHVVNPATREQIDLPSMGFDLIELCQLLQDPVTGLYKVHLVYKIIAEGYDYLIATSKIFTLGVDQQWRDLPDCPHRSWKPPFPILERPHVNGAVHWICHGLRSNPTGSTSSSSSSASDTEAGSGKFIVAFHVGREDYAVVNYPPCETSIFDNYENMAEAETLVEVQGFLQLLHLRACMNAVEVWVLKDYEKRIWARQCRIHLEFFDYQKIYVPECHHLAMIDGRSLLWTHGLLGAHGYASDIILYCPRYRTIRRVKLMSNDLVMRGNYVESVVSWRSGPNRFKVEN